MARFLRLETVLVVMLAVVGLAFFPVPRGPYSATHGPVTNLRSRYDNLLCSLRSAKAIVAYRACVMATKFAVAGFSFISATPSPSTSRLVLRI
jgi:hypothetical protein